jgi:hypothetical protein
MISYFTTIEIQNGQYVGVAYNQGNNYVIYRSKPYQSQSAAITDVNTFLKTMKAPDAQAAPQQTIVNTTALQPFQGPTKKCCGR